MGPLALPILKDPRSLSEVDLQLLTRLRLDLPHRWLPDPEQPAHEAQWLVLTQVLSEEPMGEVAGFERVWARRKYRQPFRGLGPTRALTSHWRPG
jgi:hypothetical protein